VSETVRACNELTAIVPQISSTLHFLVDFPDLENTFIPPTIERSADELQVGAAFDYVTFSDFKKSLIAVDFEPKEIRTGQFDGRRDECKPAKVAKLHQRILESKVWLLSGQPGMGKTVLTKQIAKWVRCNFPEYLEFDVHLLLRTDYFSETEWDSISVANFLLLEKPNLRKEVLEEKLNTKKVGFY